MTTKKSWQMEQLLEKRSMLRVVYVELTPDVQHQKTTAKNYCCVRVHFFEKDQHVWFKSVETAKGVSKFNWLPTDPEIAEIVDKRMQAPFPLDCAAELAKVLSKHDYSLKKTL